MTDLRPSTTYPAIVGQVIARQRTHRGLNQAQLAAALQINQSALSKIERGSTPPSVEHLALIATYLDTTPGQLLDEADRVAHQASARGVEVLPTRPRNSDPLAMGLLLIGAAALGAIVIAALASDRNHDD